MKFSNNKVEGIDPTVSYSGSPTYGEKTNRTKLILLIALIILILFIVILVIVLAVVLKKPESYPDIIEVPWRGDAYRLPKTVRPTHYDIQLFPNMYTENDTSLEGNVTITVTIVNSTHYIAFNVLDIIVSSVTLSDKTKSVLLEVNETIANKTTNMFVIVTARPMREGAVIDIKISFTGHLRHTMTGLYKGSFNIPTDNRTRYIVSTQFEPASARLAFPCLDEPEFKSLYTMHIVHKKTHQALFNTPKTLTEKAPFKHRDGDELMITHFEKTEYIMSSYLVAVAVVESYGHINGNMPDGRVMRYFAPEHRLNDLRYAAEVGSKARTELENYLGVKSPLKKVDMISIPQFQAGAMENWGLITYRERLLLLKSDDLDIYKYHICRVIAHELAHTWFGNIVTMDWWNELWLNEAFATYFAADATGKVSREWNVDAYTAVVNRRTVMLQDMTNLSLPIVKPVTKRSQMQSMFNPYVYSKGGALLNWFRRSVLPEVVFRTGLQKYLKANMYATGTENSLFEHWDKQMSNSISSGAIMKSWIYQKGFPVISIALNENNTFSIIQKSIFNQAIGDVPNTAPFNDTWWIETYFSSSQLANPHKFILEPKMKSHVISTFGIFDTTKSNSWVLLNSDSTSYIRVHYDALLFQRLVDVIEGSIQTLPPKIDELQRAIFLDDAFVLSLKGFYNYSQAFTASHYLRKETGYAPWYMFYSNLNHIDRLLDQDSYTLYMRNLTSGLYDEWDQISSMPYVFPKNLKRDLFFGLACQYEEAGGRCLTKCKDLFSAWLSNFSSPYPLPKELHKDVYFFGLQQDDSAANWNKLFSSFSRVDSKSEAATQFAYGLISKPTDARFDRLMPKLVKTEAGLCISKEDMRSRLALLTSTAAAQKAAWAWMVRECKLSQRGDVPSDFCEVFIKTASPTLAVGFHTDADRTSVEQFFNSLPGTYNIYLTSINAAIVRMRHYVETFVPVINDFLSENIE